MKRFLVRSAPETSRLLLDAPPRLLAELLFSGALERIVPHDRDPRTEETDDETLQRNLIDLLRSLSRDRVAHVEAEARRITTLAEDVAGELMTKMAVMQAFDDLPRQRDALARSLWCRLHHPRLFGHVERVLQVDFYRDRKRLFTRYDLGRPAPLAADDINVMRLGEEIAARLQHDEGCMVEVVEVPALDVAREAIMVVITSAGDFSSQKTVENRELRTFYFRPPNEVVLVYTPRQGVVEACARDGSVRRLVSHIFADLVLGVDLTGKPLSRKTFDLGRFRKSLELEIPPDEAGVVLHARLTEIQVTLGTWTRRLALKVAPEDDIHAVAMQTLGALSGIRNAGFITALEFNIRYMPGKADRAQSFSFRIFGRNSCTLQGERDPDRRELGFRLLERWGIMEAYEDLSAGEFRRTLPLILALHDHPDDETPGSFIADHGCTPDALERAGLVSRIGVFEVVLLDDELFGDHRATVTPVRAGDAVLEPGADLGGPDVAREDVTRFKVNRPLIEEKLLETLADLPRRGRAQAIGKRLVHLGEIEIGNRWVPAYLARGLDDGRVFNRINRAIRQETSATTGIVFTALPSASEFVGPHVVIALSALLDDGAAERVLPLDLQVRFAAARAGAEAGSLVQFNISGPSAGVLIVPARPPKTISGRERVSFVKALFDAHQAGTGPVHGQDVLRSLGSNHPSQLFRTKWPELNEIYIRSAGANLWELCV